MGKQLQPEITRAGQRYFDEPIWQLMQPRADLYSPLAISLANVFGTELPRPIHEIVGHNRVQLRWMKPDPNGKLVPR